MVVREVSLDQPSTSNYEDPEDPENPENEELRIKLSRDTVTVVYFGKYESIDTCAFGNDKKPN